MRTRVTSSRFIGRTGELAECEAALRDAADGTPVVVVVGGDSGVGKSRLISEFEQRGADGARFLRGECVELAGGELPYAPIVGALRELVRNGDPVLDRLAGETRGELAALAPGLGGGTATSQPSEGEAQLRLFEALLELLELLGDDEPVVLVIEDLHWADRSTRAFVAFVARSLRRERVLLVLSYRTDELHRRHPVRALLADLERGDRTRRVSLHPFDRGELAEALADILGAAPGSDLTERLFARAEGNPLYSEELLAAGLDGRGAPPQTLRDAFLLRLERLSPEAQRVLRVLAVARRSDEALLSSITGLDPAALTAALREAVEGHAIEVARDGRIVFRHALLREVEYEDLLPGERAELHLAVARALDERLETDARADLASRVASHAYSAGDRPFALRAAVRAAELNGQIHAHGEAGDLLERALELWPHLPDATAQAGLDHVQLLLRAADERDHAEERTRAEALFSAALEELDETAEPARVARVLERLARTQWALARGDDALETARRSLALTPPTDDAARAHLLAWLARTITLRGRYREAVQAAREALDLVRSSRAGVEAESQVLNTLGMALCGCGHVKEGLDELRAALVLSREHGDTMGASSAYSNLADALNHAGRTREALAVVRTGLEENPLEHTSNRLWLTCGVAEFAILTGEWSLAAEHLASVSRTPEGRYLMHLNLRRAELHLGRGELDDAERELDAIEPVVAQSLEPQFHAGFGLLQADLYRRRGAIERARDAVDTALDRIELCTEDWVRVTAVAAVGVGVEADLAQRARDHGDEGALGYALAQADAHMARVEAAAADDVGPVIAAWQATARAEHARVRGAPDPHSWAAAAEAWEAIERPYGAARGRWREAEAHVEKGDRAAASVAAGEALATARRLGAAWLAAEVDQLVARARLSSGSELSGASVAGSSPSDGDEFGLTPRERQVLELLATGATNREIGETLYMAEKTASVHVSRILAKLRVRTRTQAAAIAHRSGITRELA